MEDKNAGQEIQPTSYLLPNQTYTIQETMDKIIMNSDNNGVYLLSSILNPDLHAQTRKDLKIPLLDPTDNYSDYLTAEQFSFYFRVLYNATYINKFYSQAALKLLSKVDYNNGIRDPVPSDIVVAHKFGLLTRKDQLNVERELHDCGIVYYPDTPYLLCVMTKSNSTLPTVESAIQQISQTVYESVKDLHAQK